MEMAGSNAHLRQFLTRRREIDQKRMNKHKTKHLVHLKLWSFQGKRWSESIFFSLKHIHDFVRCVWSPTKESIARSRSNIYCIYGVEIQHNTLRTWIETVFIWSSILFWAKVRRRQTPMCIVSPTGTFFWELLVLLFLSLAEHSEQSMCPNKEAWSI